jgi:hypothetical protein
MEKLARLIGTWETEATHPAMPGVVVHGTAVVEWLEGERFLIHRARCDHPDFPDALSIIGVTEWDRVEDGARRAPAADEEKSRLRMHYYDSRGVFRVYDAGIDDTAWRWWRDAEGFSQRFTGTFQDGGDTIDGRSQLMEADTWKDDLAIVYRRRK